MISFPKKSFYFQSEVLNILSISDKELRSYCRDGLQSLFSDNGKKVFLREDIINLYAKGIVVNQTSINIIEEKLENETDRIIESLEKQDHLQLSKLKNYRQTIQSALSFISQIKSAHPQIWYNH